jgi:hypothetical protein
MLRALTSGAYRLDMWLQTHVGRPYNALLGIGLVVEIIRGATELAGAIGSAQSLNWPIFHIALATVLLIHQLGALSHRLENRGEGRQNQRGH